MAYTFKKERRRPLLCAYGRRRKSGGRRWNKKQVNRVNMKKRALAVWMGLVVAMGCFAGAGTNVRAEEPASNEEQSYTAYLTMKQDVEVHILPGTAHMVLGLLKEGMPAIAFGKTENGWIQIYYMGMMGYVPGDAVEDYAVPKPTRWEPIDFGDAPIVINALGDSITFGDTLTSRETEAYPNVLAARVGAGAVNNYGWNGSNLAGNHPDRLLDRYFGMERNADLILVMGGTNDYGGYFTEGTALGQMGDVTPETFYGGLNLLMCGLKQMYPQGDIVFITPLKRKGYMRKNQYGYVLGDYAAAIEAMGNFYGIRVLNAFEEPELDFSSKQAVYLNDGLHPNARGQALLAGFIQRKLFGLPESIS